MTLNDQWRTELDDLMRGVSGAFLFGAPLLYTMEVWWKGWLTTPPRMLLALALTYAALVILDRAVGFRSEQAPTWWRSCTDSAEALAIGILAAILGLWLIGRINTDASFDSLLGAIIMESVPFALGVGIAGELLRQQDNDDESDDEESDDAEDDNPQNAQGKDTSWRGTLFDAGSTLLGATVIALSIAPTDEVPTIASSLSLLGQIGVVLASLLISYAIVFEADFVSQDARRNQQGILQSPLGETIFSYLLSLVLAAGMLWFFQLVRVSDPWTMWLSYTIVLGLPATLGGAAGRLAI